jgi:hypothetical protein
VKDAHVGALRLSQLVAPVLMERGADRHGGACAATRHAESGALARVVRATG